MTDGVLVCRCRLLSLAKLSFELGHTRLESFDALLQGDHFTMKRWSFVFSLFLHDIPSL